MKASALAFPCWEEDPNHYWRVTNCVVLLICDWAYKMLSLAFNLYLYIYMYMVSWAECKLHLIEYFKRFYTFEDIH